ncbi:MAG: 23S rRNA (adenine(2503)-C(2))-methyltransferase RlmN [Ruminococcaceae bacterium]|nr:23S rRNA (adenine(2503)-C(2))-methyltransferase RlmN [Oscillospiraceae bacterium]
MNIYGMTPQKLEEYFTKNGENPAKAAIVFDGIYRRGVTEFALLGLSQRVTDRLSKDFALSLPEIVEKLDSSDTAKLLLKLSDGEYVETVLMKQSFGCCICVSTQIGCAMGCRFCQSGRLKRRRDLLPEEIVGQLLTIQNEFGIKVSGVSIMGIGEPFDNFDNVRDFCEILTAPKGLEIGEKHITVSTCGLVPEIYRWAELAHPCNLAISLHAPNDDLRSQLMPINRRYPLDEVIKAAQHFSEKHNRRVTMEYIMLDGVNDAPLHAQQLADLIGERNFYVNIIPYNPTDADCFGKSSRDRLMAFYDVLKKNRIGVTMRREFGSELKAACGQLSSDYTKAKA